MARCPNKKSKWWQDLVKELGDDAWFVFAQMETVSEEEARARLESLTLPSKALSSETGVRFPPLTPRKKAMPYRYLQNMRTNERALTEKINKAMVNILNSTSQGKGAVEQLTEAHGLSETELSYVDYVLDLNKGLLAMKAGASSLDYMNALADLVVIHMWDSPQMLSIRGRKGTLHNFFQQTPQYRENFTRYTEIYGDLERAGQAVMRDLLVEAFQTRARNPVSRWLRRLFNVFKRRSTKPKTEEALRKALQKELYAEIDQIARAAVKGKIQPVSFKTGVFEGRLQSKVLSDQYTKIQNLAKKLKSRADYLSAQRLERISDEHRQRLKTLKEKYDIRDVQEVFEQLSLLHHKRLANTLTDVEMEMEEDMIYMLTKTLQRFNIKELRTLNTDLSKVQRQLQDHKIELALVTLVSHLEVQSRQIAEYLQLVGDVRELDLGAIGDLIVFLAQYRDIADLLGTYAGDTQTFLKTFPNLNSSDLVLSHLTALIKGGSIQEDNTQTTHAGILANVQTINNALARSVGWIHAKAIYNQLVDAETGRVPNSTFLNNQPVTLENVYAYVMSPAYQEFNPDRIENVGGLESVRNIANNTAAKAIWDASQRANREAWADHQQLVAGMKGLKLALKAGMDPEFRKALKQQFRDFYGGSLKQLLTDDLDYAFYEYGPDKKRTGYLLGPYYLQAWEEAKQTEAMKISKILSDMHETLFGYAQPYPVGNDPNSREMRNHLLYGAWIEAMEETAASKKVMHKKLQKIQKAYSKLWEQWYMENTTPLSEEEREAIILERKKSMSAVEYAAWEAQNIKISIERKNDRETKTLSFRGELVKPSSGEEYIHPVTKEPTRTKDWRNPRYEKLMREPSFVTYYTQMQELLAERRRNLPLEFWSDYSYQYKLPQHTKHFIELFKYGRALRSLNDSGREINRQMRRLNPFVFKDPVDDYTFTKDDYAEIRYMREVRAPVRYERPLSRAEDLTTDLIYSMALYSNMALHLRYQTVQAPELHAIRFAQNFKKTPEGFAEQPMQPKDNRLAQFDEIVDQHLHQVGLPKTLLFNLARGLSGVARAAALSLMLVSSASANVLQRIQTRVYAHGGEYFTPKDYIRSKRIMRGMMPLGGYMLTPNSTLIAIANRWGMLDSHQSLFRFTRMGGFRRLFYHAGNLPLWRYGERAPTLKVLGAVLVNYRHHPDLGWMSRNQFLARRIEEGMEEKTALKEWDSLWSNWAVDENGEMLDKSAFIKKYGKLAWTKAIKGRTAYSKFMQSSEHAGETLAPWAPWSDAIESEIRNRAQTVSALTKVQSEEINKSLSSRTLWYMVAFVLRSYVPQLFIRGFRKPHYSMITSTTEAGSASPLFSLDVWRSYVEDGLSKITKTDRRNTFIPSVHKRAMRRNLAMAGAISATMTLYNFVDVISSVYLYEPEDDDDDTRDPTMERFVDWAVGSVKDFSFRTAGDLLAGVNIWELAFSLYSQVTGPSAGIIAKGSNAAWHFPSYLHYTYDRMQIPYERGTPAYKRAYEALQKKHEEHIYTQGASKGMHKFVKNFVEATPMLSAQYRQGLLAEDEDGLYAFERDRPEEIYNYIYNNFMKVIIGNEVVNNRIFSNRLGYQAGDLLRQAVGKPPIDAAIGQELAGLNWENLEDEDVKFYTELRKRYIKDDMTEKERDRALSEVRRRFLTRRIREEY